jgi:signal transduction histidine kinase
MPFVHSLVFSNGWWVVVFVFASTIAAIYFANGWRRQQEFKLQEVRSRIATDLHDDIGSSLSQVAIMCEVLSRQSLTERQTLQEIAGVSRDVLASMSEIVWAVDPSHDHLRDLTQRMRWFAGETLSGRGVALDFNALEPAREIRLDAEIRRQIFLIFKECVNNIVRHSGASHATILFRVADGQLILIVEDDGRGFDLKKVPQGNGLRNIRHRARLLQASVETQSTIGRGTLFALHVPLVQCGRDWRHFPLGQHKRAVGE